ncbi:hypothetical protein ES288_A04G164600v1 [Gossypium darwinii]|uniref:Uncharacterized protein n=1 Tax=Gossypium darwinii TaxID=34276 RepID=A0A5D2GYS7_GOSDA|nr:hypothetical protein ES288_A04G164600v1 [Gossypium darwinii]
MEVKSTAIHLQALNERRQKAKRSSVHKYINQNEIVKSIRWPATAPAAEGATDGEECWPDLGHLQRKRREEKFFFF